MELMLSLLKWSVIVGAAALLLTLFKPLLDRRYSAKWRWGAWLVMAVFLLLAPVRWESFTSRTTAAPPVVIEVPRVEVSVSRQEGISFQRPEGAALPPDGIAAKRGGAAGPEPDLSAGGASADPVDHRSGAVYGISRIGHMVFCPESPAVEPERRRGDPAGL